MKIIICLAFLFLSACSTCNIPLGNYESSGGTESHLVLNLVENEFVLTHETWLPGQYENRKQLEERGAWACQGESMTIITRAGQTKAELTVIGENPLGYPSTTKALVFEPSKNIALSQEILYPSNNQEK